MAVYMAVTNCLAQLLQRVAAAREFRTELEVLGSLNHANLPRRPQPHPRLRAPGGVNGNGPQMRSITFEVSNVTWSPLPLLTVGPTGAAA
jgi:hypothetical protein